MAAMFQDKYVFSQLTAFLNRTQFNNYVRKYDKQRLRAHFNKNESLGTVLQIIKMMIPYFEYQIVGKDVYIE